MNFRQSIRWRIQAWHGALLLAVVGACCVTIYQLQEANAFRHADTELDLRLNALTSLLGRGRPAGPPPPRPPPPRRQGEPPLGQDDASQADPGLPGGGPPPERPEGAPPGRQEGSPRGRNEGPPAEVFQAPELESLFDNQGNSPFYFCAWSRNGNMIAKSGSAPDKVQRPDLTPRGSLTKAVRGRGNIREFYAFTPPGECLLVGHSNVAVTREMRDFAWKLTAIGGAVLVLGLAGGWWLASRAIRPIAEISTAAARIAAGNLSERIQTSETESELGRLAAVLDETFQRLHAAFAQQARFTSDAAHELRTPVSVILGQTQLALGRERSAEDYRATIETCQRAANRMHGLIESLLQLSVLDSDHQSLKCRPCDLAELGRENLEMMRPFAEEKHLTLEADLAPASCEADADCISQILVNLLTNAMKFSTPGGRIRVATHRENGCAILSVSDTGFGISAEHLPHLFDRFYRADASRNRTTGGAGLGLAICKSIAEAHGGKLTVESEIDKGSTFTLRIPAAGRPDQRSEVASLEE